MGENCTNLDLVLEDFDKICRVCLEASSTLLLSIAETATEDNVKTAELLDYCLSLQVMYKKKGNVLSIYKIHCR